MSKPVEYKGKGTHLPISARGHTATTRIFLAAECPQYITPGWEECPRSERGHTAYQWSVAS